MADDFKLTIPTFSGSLGRGGVNAGDFTVQDVRELNRRLRAIEPRLKTELVKHLKQIARPMESDIKRSIRSVEPLSGMLADKGRLGWGVGVKPDKTLIQYRTSRGSKSLTTSLVRIKITSPGTVIADMAGRSGRFIGQGRRNDNASASLQRRNHSPAKGEAFINSLNREVGDGSASRFIWPAAENSIPAVRLAIESAMRTAFDFVNMRGL